MNLITLLPPFSLSAEIVRDRDKFSDVDETSSDAELLCFHLATPDLDKLHGLLWLVAKQDGGHIDPIHVHLIKGRTVRVVNDPKLHLIWNYDTVYIKPLPLFLLNFGFWTENLLSNRVAGPPTPESWHAKDVSPSCRQALGFLRTYSFLIKSATDLRLAQDLYLLPPNITFTQFNNIFSPIRKLPDDFVSSRYRWGQIRLNRLNWAMRWRFFTSPSRPLLWRYHQDYWHSKQYLQQFGPPLLFGFAAISLILSSMQVAIASSGDRLPVAFGTTTYVFSVICMIGIAFSAAIFVLGISTILLLQLVFAIRTSDR